MLSFSCVILLALSLTTTALPVNLNTRYIGPPPAESVSLAITFFLNDVSTVSSQINSLLAANPPLSPSDTLIAVNAAIKAEEDEDQHRAVLIAAAIFAPLNAGEDVLGARKANNEILDATNGFFVGMRGIVENGGREGVRETVGRVASMRNTRILPNIVKLGNLALRGVGLNTVLPPIVPTVTA
ncbi:hypothetical protein B0J14DRAFT_697589 [Halenospora varia]|nr:hypothetical protein B0J14DRAFT_697589 [Halenospora varia]